jgi:class 3 adenylate cyclase
MQQNLNKLTRQNRTLRSQRNHMIRANLALLEKNEIIRAQRGKLAEANLQLLEKNEVIREQRGKLAEANLRLLEKTEQLAAARQRTWKLLLNVLPEQVAKDLETTGRSAAREFRNVTVLFSDIAGFTRKCSTIAPGCSSPS